MVRDEAPAATRGGINEWDRPPRKSARRTCRAVILLCGPTSFVAAEIHLGCRSAGFSDEPTALQHTSCVPDGLKRNVLVFQAVPRTTRNYEARFIVAR